MINKSLGKRYLQKLSMLAASDILSSRPCERVSEGDLDILASKVAEEIEGRNFVYTAFNGDHQIFCNIMREHVATCGLTPINPDSVLGYKDTVSARQTKRGVLLDDLSVLRGCHELWVYTDILPNAESISGLAEGVLVELLYFLKRNPTRAVKFISLSDVCSGAERVASVVWEHSYQETKSMLLPDQKEELLGLANSGTKIDAELHDVRYYLLDPLDYKYSRFVREAGYRPVGEVPLVPYLAFRVEDVSDRSIALSQAILHWANLMRLASSCTILPPLDSSREPSQVVELFKRVWLRGRAKKRPVIAHWSEFDVPKAKQGSKWAITEKERKTYER